MVISIGRRRSWVVGFRGRSRRRSDRKCGASDDGDRFFYEIR